MVSISFDLNSIPATCSFASEMNDLSSQNMSRSRSRASCGTSSSTSSSASSVSRTALSSARIGKWSFRRRCKAQHTAAQNAMSGRSNQKYPALESQVSSTTMPFICLVNPSPRAPPQSYHLTRQKMHNPTTGETLAQDAGKTGNQFCRWRWSSGS
jgi:hypothetical protein